MENRSFALKTGVFAVVLLAVAIAIGIWFTRDKEQRITYTIETSGTVTGLNPQARVTFRGLVVGRVSEIKFADDAVGKILIKVSVLANTPVTESTWARLGQQGLTGLAFVELDDDGSSQQTVAASAQTHRIAMRAGTLEDFFIRGNQALSNLNKTLLSVNNVLDVENQQNIKQTLVSVKQAAGALEALTGNIQPTIARLEPLVQDMSRTVRLAGDAAQNIAQLSGSVNQLVVDFNAPGGVLDNSARTLENLSWVSSSLAIETLPRINHAATETSRAVQGVDRTVRQIQQVPQSLIFGVQMVPGPGEPGFAGFSTISPQGVTQP